MYAGYQYDIETGLYYVNARYYDSTTGRFITEDTYAGRYYDPLSLNRYTYCRNNPLRYTDPSGHIFLTILAGALIGAAIGAGVEIVSQKVVEKKEEIDWKAVGYEAAVGAVSGAVGGLFGKAGGSVLGAAKATGKSVTKIIAKRVIKAGISEAVSGFATDAGRQLFVEGKSVKKLDFGRLFRTAGISGLTGIAGAMIGVFKDIFSEYRVETVQRTVTRVRTVNRCQYGNVDCPNHPNHPVTLGTYQEVVTVPEFIYVGKQGAENAAKSAAAGLDDDVAGIVARKKSPLDQVRGWFKKKVNAGGRNSPNVDLTIASRNSSRGNPGAIMHFDIDLNKRQKKLLQQLTDFDSSIIVNKNDVNLKDIAALTAKTGDEFAMFTRGSQRMVVRGNSRTVNITTKRAQELYNLGFKWSGHTHPGIGRNIKMASEGDMGILEKFNQFRSVILDSFGDFGLFEIER